MSIGKGIKLSTGFDLNSKAPLDNRTVFKTVEERDSLPSINLYEGLSCYVIEEDKNYQYRKGSWIDHVNEIKEMLQEKIDDVVLTENNVLEFYADGVLKKSIQLPSKFASAICGEFLCGELTVGEGVSLNRVSEYVPTEWIDNVTPVNAFNLNKIEDKLVLLSRQVETSLGVIHVGDEEPDTSYEIWVDTSDVTEVTSKIEDSIIDEFRSICIFLQTEITKLKDKNKELEDRISYLEQNGGGGIIPPPSSDNEILIFEDGTRMTFEDGNIMVFEKEEDIVPPSGTILIFEDGTKMLFEDDTYMVFEKEEDITEPKGTVLTFEDELRMIFENNDLLIFEQGVE